MTETELPFRAQLKAAVRNELLDQLLTNGRAIKPAAGSLPPRPLSSHEFAIRDFKLEWFVEGLMVMGQPGVIGAPKKSLKTGLSVDLTISLASGTPFLGQFQVPQPRRVCLFSGESGPATLKETAIRVCRSKSIDLQSLPAFWDFRLPAFNSEKNRERVASMIKQLALQMVIIDPLYLSLPTSASGKTVNPANLFEMGPLLQTISQTCLRAGATPIFVHHTKKMGGTGAEIRSKYAPIELDALSFSGVPEFARQWMLLNRREEYVLGSGQHKLWMSVGGSAGFSGCWAVDVDEGQVVRNFSGRGWKVTIRSQTQELEEKEARKVVSKQEKEHKDRTDVMDLLKQSETPQTQTDICGATGISKARVKSAVEHLVKERRIKKSPVTKACGTGTKTHDGYTISKQVKKGG